VLDPEVDREAWQGEQVGSACEDNVIHRVNVSASYGAVESALYMRNEAVMFDVIGLMLNKTCLVNHCLSCYFFVFYCALASISELGDCKGSVGAFPRILTFLSAVSPGFSLV